MLQPVIAALIVCVSTLALSQDQDAAALIRGGHIKQAKSALETKLKQNPQDANALWQMARVKIDYNDLDGAITLAQQATAADDNNSDAHCTLAEAMGTKAQRGTAGMFEKMRLARGIRKEAERALLLNPKHTDCMDVLIEYYREAPSIVGGDKKKSEEMLVRMIQTDPVKGNLKAGNIAASAKDTPKTESAYKAALAAGPKSYEANIALASLYANDTFKKYDVTQRLSRDAIQIDPKRITGYSLLVQTLLLEKKDSEAETVLAQAEKNVPHDLGPNYQAGRVLLVLNRDFPKAEKYFRKFLTQEPEPVGPTLAHAHWRLAQALEKQGRKPDAISEEEIAIKLKPDLKPAYDDLKRMKQ
jgi:tetratricopeptide (TPR) repeat protein